MWLRISGINPHTSYIQLQEVTSLMEARSEVVGRNLEEINGQFDCHRGEINHLKRREEDLKEKEEELRCEDLFLISLTTCSFSFLFPDLNMLLNCSLCNPLSYAYSYHQDTPKGLWTTSRNS